MVTLLGSVRDNLCSSCKKQESHFAEFFISSASAGLPSHYCCITSQRIRSHTTTLQLFHQQMDAVHLSFRGASSFLTPPLRKVSPFSCHSSACWYRLSRSWWRPRCPGDGWRWRDWRRHPAPWLPEEWTQESVGDEWRGTSSRVGCCCRCRWTHHCAAPQTPFHWGCDGGGSSAPMDWDSSGSQWPPLLHTHTHANTFWIFWKNYQQMHCFMQCT